MNAREITLLECPTCRRGCLEATGTLLCCEACRDRFPIERGVAWFMRRFDDYTENYDAICADDLATPKTPTVVKEVLAGLVAARARGVVCDLGCGDGYIIRRVPAEQKIAVDIARAYLERLPDSITRLWARAEDVPLRAQSVDTLVCTDVIEHVLDVAPVSDEIARLLKPHGRLLLAVPFEQDLGVYDLPEYRAKYAKYRYVHLRSIDDAFIRKAFPGFGVLDARLITEGMALMEFKPYPIKFLELAAAAS